MTAFKKLKPITRWLLALFFVIIVINLGLRSFRPSNTVKKAASSVSIEATAVVSTKPDQKTSFPITGNDSWGPMIAALEHYKNTPDEPIYAAVLFKGAEKFQYPPSGLLVFDLPERILGWSYSKSTRVLNALSLVCVLLMGLITGKILMRVLQESRFEKYKCSTLFEKSILYATIVMLTIIFYPIWRSYDLGQIQTILIFLGVLSILSWQYERKGLTGILIGLTCLVKPQLALLFIWGAIRHQWKMVLTGSVVMVGFLLLSIVLYGFGNHLDYLSVLSYISHHGEAFYMNQSMNGIMNRILFNGNNLSFSNHDFPPYSLAVYTVTLISSLSFILLGLFWKNKNKQPDIIDMSIMILCAIMASPVAWKHHYGILLCIFILSMPYILFYFSNWKSVLILSIGLLLTAINIQLVNQLADTKWNVLQSYSFFGACIILVFLFRISYRNSREPTLKVLPSNSKV